MPFFTNAFAKQVATFPEPMITAVFNKIKLYQLKHKHT